MSDVSGTLEQILGSLAEYRIESGRIVIRENLDDIGIGGYGTVMLGDLQDWGGHPFFPVAVKVLRTPSFSKEQRAKTAARLGRELKIWAGLIHPNILRLIGFYLSEDLHDAWLISPYAAFGNLTEYISRKQPDQARQLELIIDAAKGLMYLHLHEPGIVHGDLKPANIIIGRDGSAKLCDFGLAKALDDPTGLTSTTSIRGSPRYMGPELLEDNAALTIQSDMWALGCIAGEVLTGLMPYHAEKSRPRLFMRIGRYEAPISFDGFNIPKALRICIAKCWQPVATRPLISDCVNELLDVVSDFDLALYNVLSRIMFRLSASTSTELKRLEDVARLLWYVENAKEYFPEEDEEFARLVSTINSRAAAGPTNPLGGLEIDYLTLTLLRKIQPVVGMHFLKASFKNMKIEGNESVSMSGTGSTTATTPAPSLGTDVASTLRAFDASRPDGAEERE